MSTDRDKLLPAVFSSAMPHALRAAAVLAAALLLAPAAHAQSVTPTPSPTPSPTPTPTATPTPDPVIAAAGDIACDPADPYFNGGQGSAGFCRQRATSDLIIGAAPTAVLPLGDTQYEEGVLSTYQQSYALSWGRLKAISHPVVGNHEYFGDNGAGYFDYFNGPGVFSGPAGDRDKGYYSYDVGRWHVIALNSICSQVGGCGPGSPQEQWLRADLAAHPAACTLAYWHHARFTSTGVGWTSMQTMWRDLYDAGAEVVLSGHIHYYERFAPQSPDGVADPVFGVRQFVVGTGGKNLESDAPPTPNSELRDSDHFGVLLMTLGPDGYTWRFARTDGTVGDSGQGACHGPPPVRPAAGATGAATTTGRSKARLTAAVDPGNQPTTYRFEYGPNTGYGLETDETPVGGAPDGPRQVAAAVSRLVPGRTYHYRVVATNASGPVPGADRTFVAGARTAYVRAMLRTRGLLAYWRLGEPGLSFDERGDALAVDAGNPSPAPGALIGDRSLSGAYDGGAASTEADGPVVSARATLEGWFLWLSGTVLMRDDSSAGGWYIASESRGRLGFRIAGRSFRTRRPIERVRDGTWHHIAVTKDHDNVVLYLDGRRIYRSGGAPDVPATMPWHIMRNGPFEEHAEGNADEVAVYDRPLSAATIRAHYLAGVAKRAPRTRARGPEGPTNDATPSFALGANVKGATMRCRLDGPGQAGALAACGSPMAFGPLVDGSYALTAYAVDPTGHPDPTALVRRFTVDTVTPDVTVQVGTRVPASLRRDGLAASVTCSETCDVSATLSMAGAAARRLRLSKGRAVDVGAAARRIPAAKAGALRVRLDRRTAKRLKGRRPPALTLRVVARDRAGNARVVQRTLTRP